MKINWDKVILNSRPENMGQDDYKLQQKAFKYLLKLRKQFGIGGIEVIPKTDKTESQNDKSENGSVLDNSDISAT